MILHRLSLCLKSCLNYTKFLVFIPLAAPTFAANQPTALPAKKASSIPSNAKAMAATPAKSAAPTENTISDDSDDQDVPSAPKAKGGVVINGNSIIKINYGRQDWNRDSTKVDSAAIYMREGTSGRIVQVEVEETEPDSAVFSGAYSINWQNLDRLKTEFYAPPHELLLDLQGRKKITAMIDSKALKRLPFVLRRDPKTGVQNIELFDNAEQARFAFKAIQAEQQLLTALQNKVAERDQTVDTALLALQRAQIEEASKNLAARLRLGQLEAQKLAAALNEFSKLSPQEREKQKKLAADFAEQALVEYRAGRFEKARELFEKAVSSDPSNQSYYFQYGVTLYKLEDFNRAIVYLELSDGKEVNRTERDFYRGLAYYRTKDAKAALAAFKAVSDAKDPLISPSANFYQGVIHFESKTWDAARNSFQAVLDGSSDPALDDRAEAYIEQILRQQQFEAERARKFSLAATVGGIYDDNVVLSSDSTRSTGSGSNVAGYRALLQSTFRYRPVYEETREMAVQLDFLMESTVDSSFQANQTLKNADPTVIGLTVPFTHKGMFLGRGHKMDVIPGYEVTYMSVDNNETKAIYSSATLGFQNLLVMSQTWYSNYNVDLRQDRANMSTSTGDNDANAIKTKLTWSNILMPFEQKNRLVTTETAYTMNQSVGKNVIYNRLDLSAGYIQPFKWDTTLTSKLGYFYLNYPQNSNGRLDSSYTLTIGASKPVWTDKILGVTTAYNINNSNVDSYQYKHLTINVTLTSNWNF